MAHVAPLHEGHMDTCMGGGPWSPWSSYNDLPVTPGGLGSSWQHGSEAGGQLPLPLMFQNTHCYEPATGAGQLLHSDSSNSLRMALARSLDEQQQQHTEAGSGGGGGAPSLLHQSLSGLSQQGSGTRTGRVRVRMASFEP